MDHPNRLITPDSWLRRRLEWVPWFPLGLTNLCLFFRTNIKMIVFLKCCVDTILSVYLNVLIAWFILKMILVCPRVQLALWVVLLGPRRSFSRPSWSNRTTCSHGPIQPWALWPGPSWTTVRTFSFSMFSMCQCFHLVFRCQFILRLTWCILFFCPQWSPSTISASRLGQRIPSLAARTARS